MRKGAELVQASQPFAKEHVWHTWFHFLSTALVYSGADRTGVRSSPSGSASWRCLYWWD